MQTTASEATFVALLAARTEAIKKYRARDQTLDDAEINARLVAYCSDQVASQSINQSIKVFYSGLSNLNHCEVH